MSAVIWTSKVVFNLLVLVVLDKLWNGLKAWKSNRITIKTAS